MNKVLHAIVYLILVAAVAALVFEKSLFDKRSLLSDRNRAMEDYIVRLARTIEKADAALADFEAAREASTGSALAAMAEKVAGLRYAMV